MRRALAVLSLTHLKPHNAHIGPVNNHALFGKELRKETLATARVEYGQSTLQTSYGDQAPDIATEKPRSMVEIIVAFVDAVIEGLRGCRPIVVSHGLWTLLIESPFESRNEDSESRRAAVGGRR